MLLCDAPSQELATPVSRRVALQAALGSAYAAAVLPVSAETRLETSSQGLRARSEILHVGGATIPFYYAAPLGKTQLPVILVVQEVFGVHAYIADICRRLAHAGYLAIAPELYARQGDPRQYSDVPTLLKELVSRVPDAQVLADLDAAADWAAANGGDGRRLGITGFCWGGRITWLYAAHRRQVRAAVAWYGKLEGPHSELTPLQPVDVAAQLHAPVLGLYGGQDAGIPLTSVNAMKEALAEAARQGRRAAGASQFVLYPDAPHAFHADYRPSYRDEAARDAYARALAWFQRHGV